MNCTVKLHPDNAADQKACCVSCGNLVYTQMISPCFRWNTDPEKSLESTELPSEQKGYLGQLLWTSHWKYACVYICLYTYTFIFIFFSIMLCHMILNLVIILNLNITVLYISGRTLLFIYSIYIIIVCLC